MARTAKPTVADQLAGVPAATRPTIDAARRMVLAIAPKADEITYGSRQPSSPSMMWKLTRYAVGGVNVVGLGTFTKHSSLFFYRGRELDDGTGLLQGGGKDSRFITLREPADAERTEVKRMVRKAFELELR
jgi:hypothetical protein